jgi:hypothetical protein
MKNNIFKIYTVAFYLCSTIVAFAQPGTGSNEIEPLESEDPIVPINNYIWVLAILGVTFVFLRFRVIYRQRIGS